MSCKGAAGRATGQGTEKAKLELEIVDSTNRTYLKKRVAHVSHRIVGPVIRFDLMHLMGAAGIPTSTACPWGPISGGFIPALQHHSSRPGQPLLSASGIFDATAKNLTYWEP